MIGALNYEIHVIHNEQAKCMMYEERTDLDKKVNKGTLTELYILVSKLKKIKTKFLRCTAYLSSIKAL